MAAYYGQVSVIEYLATNQIKSANVNLKSSKGGLTPLHFAVRGCLKRWKKRKPLSQRNPNFKETIDMFIALRADSTIKNDKKGGQIVKVHNFQALLNDSWKADA